MIQRALWFKIGVQKVSRGAQLFKYVVQKLSRSALIVPAEGADVIWGHWALSLFKIGARKVFRGALILLVHVQRNI